MKKYINKLDLKKNSNPPLKKYPPFLGCPPQNSKFQCPPPLVISKNLVAPPLCRGGGGGVVETMYCN